MNRQEWEFEYTASVLADAAEKKQGHHLGRVEWWKTRTEQVMEQIRESGIEIRESVASEYKTHSGHGPSVHLNSDLENKLKECHQKVQGHRNKAEEYGGWVQALRANKEDRLKLTINDWLYFFEVPDPAEALDSTA